MFLALNGRRWSVRETRAVDSFSDETILCLKRGYNVLMSAIFPFYITT